jgi:ABC-type transport system involved in multi-copper enzyme maturation permease subunit
LRLLGAEVRKLRRPLLWGTALAAMAFILLLGLGAAQNARSAYTHPSVRGDCSVAAMPQCQSELDQARTQAKADGRDVARQLSPGGAGRVAAGMLASVPGLAVVALLAGAHAGGEWSGGTIRTMLTHDGRRLRFLTAKWLSLWIAAVAVTLGCWVALAVAGPALAAVSHLLASGTGPFSGFAGSATQTARAAVVLGLFTLVGVTAASVTRNTIGTVAAVAGVFVVALIAGGVQAVARFSPATSIQAWMSFTFARGYPPTNFWSRFEAPNVALSSWVGLGGIALAALAAAGLAACRIRADITA